MRSMRGLVLVAFACGVCFLQTCAALPPWPGVVAIAATVALAWALARSRRALAVVAALVLGAAYAAWRAEARLSDALAPEWEGETVVVTGVVDDLPTLTDRGSRFALAVESASPGRARVPSRVSLAWYAQDDGAADPPEVHAGERWRLAVRLRRPHGNVNPGGFDLEAWLLQQDLRAAGFVVTDARNERLAAFVGRFGDHVQRARERVRERIRSALDGAPHAGVVVALAIGDQRWRTTK